MIGYSSEFSEMSEADKLYRIYDLPHNDRLSPVGDQPISYYINCPIFGFKSLLPTFWYRIHKGIIWTSTLRILVSLFNIPTLFDTSSLIDIFLGLSPIYWLVCLQRRENYSQLSYNLFHPYSVYWNQWLLIQAKWYVNTVHFIEILYFRLDGAVLVLSNIVR